LIALGLLVAGVLYQNQFEDGLINLREQSLETQGMIIAESIADILESQDNAAEIPDGAVRLIDRMSAPSNVRAQLFDADGIMLGDTFFMRRGEQGPEAEPEDAKPEQKPSAMTSILNQVWVRAARLFKSGKETLDGALSSDFSNAPAREAMDTGETIRVKKSNRDGEIVVSVAVPVVASDRVRGAVVLSTPGGEIDNIVRSEREQILQVFVLAMLSSIALSLVLANTIARPIRDLAEAAEKGGATSTRRLNPERIRIPDMTARPDEIGYLSGAMRMMTAALYDRIEANEVFAADVAHEIKNPLTSLRSAVETLRLAHDDDARARLMSVIEKDVKRLDRLVTDISNASRLDSELVRDEMETFDLSALLRNLVEYNRANAEKAGATIVVNLPDDPIMVNGLEGRLAQVFVNLITNAISFSPEGGVVTVKALKATNGMVRVSVEDNGAGIPDDNLGDVFTRFYSERPQKEFGNHSGLGLAISKQIVDAHGGEIWAQNIRPRGAGRDTPPQGARFVVELPQ
ncbi:MAG: ATP-binding protein, partial [Paracoccaceae bacterium]